MKIGIRSQHALYTFLVTLVICSFIIIYAVHSKKIDIYNEFIIKGQSLSTVVSESLVSPLYELKVDQISRLIVHVLADSDISHAYVIDSEGYILSDGTEENEFSDELISDVYPSLRNEYHDDVSYLVEEKSSIFIVKPVTTASGDRLGAVVFEMTLLRANQLAKRSMVDMGIISLVTVVIGLFLAFVTANRQIKPITQIKKAAENIANGDLQTRLFSTRNDELGELANTIDNMAEQLLLTTVSKGYVNRIIHTMPDGLVIVDDKGNIRDVNPYIDTLLGASTGVLVDIPFSDLFSRNDFTERSSGVESNSNHDGEYSLQFNKFVIPVQVAFAEIEGPDGQRETLVIVHDIRRQKRLEHEREKALVKAEESTRLKSEFLASMSHEIRTPMNGVIGMLRLLMSDTLSEKQHHYATLASSSADSLLSLINDILDFSKIESGKLDLEVLDFNLLSMLGEFSEIMAHRTQDKGLELVLDVTKVNYSMVRGDPGRLRQVLTNLVSNAIKFTESGEIVIRVALEKKDNNALAFKCSVSDTGIGIPPEKLDTLFDSFTQVDASTTRKYGGTGLGLAIANQLCEQMGAGLQVKSVPGKGSCFEFCINLLVSDKSVAVLPRVDVSQTRILIVDDNATNLEVLRGQLELWDAVVTEVSDGPAALRELYQRLDQEPDKAFQIAILDMNMPGMDGAALGKTIRADKHLDGLKLIMMTSVAERGDAQFFSDLGFSAFFPKPVTPSDLFNALNVVLDDGEALSSALPLVTHHNLQCLKSHTDVSDARILVVEDIAVNQLIALGILEDIELNAHAVGNGVEALAALNESTDSTPYHLILMDCQMPEMDGYEATRQIRSGACGVQNCKIPIVAMTANAMKGDKERCLEAGMDDYIAKPVDPDVVEEKVLYWLNKEKQEKSVL